MCKAASLISMTASGQSQKVEGHVVITASDAMSTYHMPAILQRLREIEPGIVIEVVSSNEVHDLLKREADIAIRHVKPEQPDLITKHVRDISVYLYASSDYLKKLGYPSSKDDLASADFIGFENADRSLSPYKSLGLSLTKSNIRYVTNNWVVTCEMIKQGLGIGLIDENTAAITPEIERVLPEIEPIKIPIWLTTHRELHTNRIIRIVFDVLVKELRK